MVYENFIGTSGVVLRKELLSIVGAFDESLRYSEDRYLWFRIAHQSDALFWNQVGHSYRIRRGSLSDGPQIPIARARIAVLQREQRRWNRGEFAIRCQINNLVAANLAAMVMRSVVGTDYGLSRCTCAPLSFHRKCAGCEACWVPS